MRPVCIALAVLASLAGAAPAADAKPPKKPKSILDMTFKEKHFLVSLEGSVTTTWRYSHASTGTCDSGYHGEGFETVDFAIKDAPRKMTGFFLGTGRPILVRYWGLPFGSEPANYPAEATVERESSDDTIYKPPPEWCPDRFGGVSGDELPQPDCGKHGPVDARVRLEYGKKKDRLHVLEEEPFVHDDFYHHCGGVGTQLALEDVPLKLHEAKLLKLKRELRLKATGQRERPLENGFVRTTIRYELTIEPVKHRKGGS
jgi:hypothetical protein